MLVVADSNVVWNDQHFEPAMQAATKGGTGSIEIDGKTVVSSMADDERCSAWTHPSNPIAYVHITGSEDEVRWMTSKGLLDDDWKDTGARLEIGSELVVFDAFDRRGAIKLTLPGGTYQVREARYFGESDVALLLIAQDDFIRSLE